MRLAVSIENNLKLRMDQEIRAGQMAVTGIVSGATAAIKANWRQQVVTAGLGRRLANAVRAEVYPRGRVSLNAAGTVFSNAQKIVGAFEKGVEIRAKNGRFLALPITKAGFRAGGGRGSRITPSEWQRRTGRVLAFVPRRNGTALLVDDGTRRAATGRRLRRGEFGPRQARTNTKRVTPIFILVPRVRLSKRLGLFTAATRLAAGMGARLGPAWGAR
jgi:hypothetical protein